jgi:cytochrome b involved in lipid metabolism
MSSTQFKCRYVLQIGNTCGQQITVVIDTHIYDITNFIHDHPGNRINDGQVSKYNRKNVSVLFEKYHGKLKHIHHILASARQENTKILKYMGTT